jgi:hypothetical protein
MLAKPAPRKLTRAELLTMEAEIAVLEEQRDELKRSRPRCESCGRLEVVRGSSKLEVGLRAFGTEIRAKREVFRNARARSAPKPTPTRKVKVEVETDG